MPLKRWTSSPWALAAAQQRSLIRVCVAATTSDFRCVEFRVQDRWYILSPEWRWLDKIVAILPVGSRPRGSTYEVARGDLLVAC